MWFTAKSCEFLSPSACLLPIKSSFILLKFGRTAQSLHLPICPFADRRLLMERDRAGPVSRELVWTG